MFTSLNWGEVILADPKTDQILERFDDASVIINQYAYPKAGGLIEIRNSKKSISLIGIENLYISQTLLTLNAYLWKGKVKGNKAIKKIKLVQIQANKPLLNMSCIKYEF